MHVIVVEFVIKPEFVDRFLPEMVANARLSRDIEPGCRQFDVTRDVTDARRIVLYEIYDDVQAFNEHLRSPHFQRFDANIATWVERKVVHTLERIDPA